MDSDLYSTSAQIIVVLMLALGIEHRAYKDLSEKSLFGFVSRVQQMYVYVWAVLGLGVSLLHLASFNFGWLNLGKLTVLVSILAMLMLLVSTHIMGSQRDEMQKRGYATIAFIFLPLLLTTIVSSLELFSDAYVDMIFVNSVATAIMIPAFVVVFRNKKYLLEVMDIIGVSDHFKHGGKGEK